MGHITAEYADGTATSHQGYSGSRCFEVFQRHESIHEFVQTLDRDGIPLFENTVPYVGFACQRSGMALGSPVYRGCQAGLPDYDWFLPCYPAECLQKPLSIRDTFQIGSYHFCLASVRR